MISFLEDEIELSLKDSTLNKSRNVWQRRILDENGNKDKLDRYISGKIPYFYRDPFKIANDFSEKLDVIGLIADVFRKLPTTEKFRSSHFGEILGSIYIEEILGYKILLRKLTQLTAENTNVHKMDIMCVDTSNYDFKYWWFEVKTSIQPASKKKAYHRHGIYKQLKESLEKYSHGDKMYDFVQIRDNLSKSDFSLEEIKQIRKDFSPPGPEIFFHGLAVINIASIDDSDNDYIISEPSSIAYNVRVLTITDLKSMAIDAYERLENIKKATGE